MKITLYPSSKLTKQFILSHSWLGLCIGAIMYVICFTGTVLVFSQELERWEQPSIDEFKSLSASSVTTAINQFSERVEDTPETIYVILPTDAIPRAHISAEGQEWFMNSKGELTEVPLESWLHMLRELHYYLHLPHTMGMIIVGAFGTMLLALIISGILSHSAIVKEAFNFRVFDRARIAQTDIHNRLSVWGLPFHITIALTGAYIGLVSIIIATAAPLYFEGDRNKVVEAIYGGDPTVNQEVTSFNVHRAFVDLSSRSPSAEPIYLAFHKMGTENQFLEVAAAFPDRLTYSEIFRYDAQGIYINHQGLSDGPIGRQAAYSVYRLHFGHFGGFIVKILYGIFGLALTIVSASGINIWLTKRNTETRLNRIWAGFVWGLPLALVITALVCLFIPTFATQVFWGCYVSAVANAAISNSAQAVKNNYKIGLAYVLVSLALAHFFKYNTEMSSISIGVNSVVLIAGITFICIRFLLMKTNTPETSGVIEYD